MILNVDPKTVTNVGNAYLEGGLDSALYDEERCGRPIDFDDRERSRIVAMVCSDLTRVTPIRWDGTPYVRSLSPRAICRRRSMRYAAGMTKRESSGAVIIPPIIGAAMRCMTSEPVP